MKSVSCLIVCALLLNILDNAEAEFDSSSILSVINNMPTKDKLLFVAQYLLDNEPYYKDLENTFISALPILTYDKPPGHFTYVFLPWALHHLPGLLQNDLFQDVIHIFIAEINSHNETDDWFHKSGNTTERMDFYVKHLFGSFDVDNMITDILQLTSFRKLLQSNSSDQMTCFNQTLSFLGQLFFKNALQPKTNMTDGNKTNDTVCFSCEDLSDPSFCNTITKCNNNQICFIESYTSAGGHLHYRAGCRDKQKCRLHNVTEQTDCHHCCETSFCNNQGCGGKGLPARQSRGPLCFDCAHIDDPKNCDQITFCSLHETCHIEEMKWGESSLFQLGCQSVHQCSYGFEKRSVPICRACCHDDFCNLNCTKFTQNNQQIFVG